MKLLRLLILSTLLVPQLALGHMPDEIQAKQEARAAERAERIESIKASVKAKLDSKKLQICERREANINRVMDRAVKRSQAHLTFIDRAITRTKTFYVKKELEMADYQSQLDGLTTKREEAHTAIDALAAQTDFDCDSDNPKEYLQNFQTLRQDKLAKMKAYRQAAISFMQSVKAAHADSQSQEGDE